MREGDFGSVCKGAGVFGRVCDRLQKGAALIEAAPSLIKAAERYEKRRISDAVAAREGILEYAEWGRGEGERDEKEREQRERGKGASRVLAG